MSHDVIQSLETYNVRFVRILWCDNANIIRGKAVHMGMFPTIYSKRHTG